MHGTLPGRHANVLASEDCARMSRTGAPGGGSKSSVAVED
jgi:hypothetical protein